MNLIFHIFGLTVASVAARANEVPSADQIAIANFQNETQKFFFQDFLTGYEFCERYNSVIKNEKGFWVFVPVDYKDSHKGKTKIFAYWAGGFYDSELPTILEFDGGPGANSHGTERVFSGFNHLHFDQRGIGCSSPSSLSLYRDPKFYSSENTARDAEEIRKQLDIEKISIFGVSYGTGPATIYANLFPERTQAVVLEGTMYAFGENNEDFSDSKFINYYLDQMYKKFPQATKDAMLSYFDSEEKAFAIFNLARLKMYENNGFGSLKDMLLDIFPNTTSIKTAKAEELFGSNIAPAGQISQGMNAEERLPTINNFVFNVFACNELRLSQNSVSVFGNIEGQKYEFEHLSFPAGPAKTCEDLGLNGTDLYSASRYPLKVPVSYIQGTWDGATFPRGAIYHYKNQAFGHTPQYVNLMSSNAELRSSQLRISEALFKGQLISHEDLDSLNAQETEVTWTYTSKPPRQMPTALNEEGSEEPAPSDEDADSEELTLDELIRILQAQ